MNLLMDMLARSIKLLMLPASKLLNHARAGSVRVVRKKDFTHQGVQVSLKLHKHLVVQDMLMEVPRTVVRSHCRQHELFGDSFLLYPSHERG